MSLLILSACSGTGKSTIIHALLTRHSKLRLSVSHTTRLPRSGEVDGVDYHFSSRAQFESMIEKGLFIEWAEFAGNLYGTAHEEVSRANAGHYDLLFDVEVIGAAALKKSYPQALSCFLLPPDWHTLEQRLTSRGTEDSATVARRLDVGRRDIVEAQTFDYLIVNDELSVAIEEMSALYTVSHLTPFAQKARLKQLIQQAQGV